MQVLPQLGLVEAFKKVVKENYANFEGRARRSEYWYFNLASCIISWGISLIGILIFGNEGNGKLILSALYGLAILIPTWAVSIRRMHDIGKSGWWILINLVPCIGGIWFIVLCCQDSDQNANQYGPSPKYVEEN